MTLQEQITALERAKVNLARIRAYDYTPAVELVRDDIDAVLAQIKLEEEAARNFMKPLPPLEMLLAAEAQGRTDG